MGEYAEFLNALRAEDPELAVAHAPRIGSAVYWSPEEDGVYRAPFTDPDGDVIGPQLPLFMMHLEGADAYARWLSARLGGRVRLPTSDEWHVAGSGGDGRAYPWGVGFDPALCWMAESPNANRGPVPVGSHPRDRSPLGMMDVVGNVREWASDARTAEPIMRSGAWQASREQCRLGRRSVSAHGGAYVTLGVRLVQQLSTSNE
jgi:formylglycine-generating enzyme required for sulfatase activity